MEIKKDPQILIFKTQQDWEKWLSRNFELEEGVLIKMYKKATGIESIDPPQALEIALCYGWIDGIRKGLDEKSYLQKYTPRRKRSIWSKINIGHVERLVKEGRMKASGLKAFEDAKVDGRLDLAYDSPKTMVIPEDFLKLLSKNKKAFEFFKTLKKVNTYAISFRLQTAKKPETRLKRIKSIIGMLEEQNFH